MEDGATEKSRHVPPIKCRHAQAENAHLRKPLRLECSSDTMKWRAAQDARGNPPSSLIRIENQTRTSFFVLRSSFFIRRSLSDCRLVPTLRVRLAPNNIGVNLSPFWKILVKKGCLKKVKLSVFIREALSEMLEIRASWKPAEPMPPIYHFPIPQFHRIFFPCYRQIILQ